ncbi:prenyltransferase [Halobacillus massiliensis]|uniref:prenyltransferase n=1 Tax=Halobacillus massiliensis TaxID=1926286 RepID=UPI0009E2D407|nr:prenyltransferase [Halobacillus massiliensis]
MTNQALTAIKNGWVLLRSIAVISSSGATIVSTILPLLLYYSFSVSFIIRLFCLLLVGSILIHGILTHLLNDYTDHLSGTDYHSPAILSGGSRVIQNGLISAEMMGRLGKGLIAVLIAAVIGLFLFGFLKLAILLSIGLWGAITYSLPPLRLSYRPIIGEWLSTFPSVLFLGVAGAWLSLDTIPEWAWQNSVINALFCISWVMVHHIPDYEADKNAVPSKKTSVVWSVDRFGIAFSRLPALIYFLLTGLCVFWLGLERLWAALGVGLIIAFSIYLILKMNVESPDEVSNIEKILLLMAVINAIWVGIFI